MYLSEDSWFFLSFTAAEFIRNLSLSEWTPAIQETKCNTQLTFAKVNKVCSRLSCLYKRGCVLWVQSALLISVHFCGHACSFVCKRGSGMSNFSEASWDILMGVNGVQLGLLWVLWASCQQGSLILRQLNRLSTDCGSLFWQHSPHIPIQSPLNRERLHVRMKVCLSSASALMR